MLRWAHLDQYLNRPDADPYDLFEMAQSSVFDQSASGLWHETLLRITRDANYRALAEDDAKSWDPFNRSLWRREEDAAFEATLAPELRTRIAVLEKRFEERVRAFGGSIEEANYKRESIPAPKSAHFAELKLPPCAAPRRASPVKLDPKTFPSGYQAVRTERDGDIVAVISLSQNYDQAGEVSGGGFWVHLSNDRGKTWEAPRYTGLAQHFPYVVRPESCLALIAGDHLHVEVEIKEIDTASISYPPVGMRLRREQSGLYLDMPLSELRKDQDGDGLTDIAEESLLLDPSKADSDGDGVADGKDPFPNVAYSGKRGANDEAMIAVLRRLSKRGFGALIEPVDRKPGDLPGGWGVPALPLDRPLFLGGSKADFGGFTAKQMTLVYSDEEIAKIRRMKADFHATKFSALTLNRAGTRGFISWSAGWVGGMFRVVKVDKGWRVEELMDWIT